MYHTVVVCTATGSAVWGQVKFAADVTYFLNQFKIHVPNKIMRFPTKVVQISSCVHSWIRILFSSSRCLKYRKSLATIPSINGLKCGADEHTNPTTAIAYSDLHVGVRFDSFRWSHVSIRCMYTPWTDKNLVWRDGIAVIILFLLLCFVHVRKKWEETVYASGLSTVLEMDWENITLKSHHSWELRLPYRLSRRGFSILCLIFLTVKKIKSYGWFCILIQCSSD